MEYRIGIASYGRADRQLTLEYLRFISFPKDRIIMSVQTEKDYCEYREKGIDREVGTFIFERAETAAGNRNTILNHAGTMERVVLIDDDVKYISRLQGDRLEKVDSLEEFDRMVKKGYFLAKKHRTLGFGIYPVHNAYFMSPGYTPANICDAGLFAVVNTSMRFDTSLRTKEDYDFCCRAIERYGAFVRLNGYAVNSPEGHRGGCEDAWKDRRGAERTARLLVGKYPDILALNTKRPGEVKMKTGGKRK